MSVRDRVIWPAVIRYDGDDELTYIGSAEEWKRDAESHLYHHTGDDRLIDSRGRIYRIEHQDEQITISESADRRIRLDDFVRLVRIHASSAHQCCIEKINFRTIAEGIALIAGMKRHD